MNFLKIMFRSAVQMAGTSAKYDGIVSDPVGILRGSCLFVILYICILVFLQFCVFVILRICIPVSLQFCISVILFTCNFVYL